MELGELYDAFVNLENDDFVFTSAFGSVMSYRGSYVEVAFSPETNVSLKTIKELLNRAFNETFEGYKGGEFNYDSDTPAHLAYYGTCDDENGAELEALVGIMLVDYAKAVHPLKEKKMTKRKTKLERELERETEAKALFQELLSQWPQRMMTLLKGAFEEDMKVTSDPSALQFVVEWRNNLGYEDTVFLKLNPETDSDLLESPDCLQLELDCRRYAREEANRKLLARNVALAKLTKEERELLGV